MYHSTAEPTHAAKSSSTSRSSTTGVVLTPRSATRALCHLNLAVRNQTLHSPYEPVRGNGSSPYCTTKAYGFPLCWKVEHCLCNKGKVVYYPQGVVGNMLMSAVAATVVAVARRKRE